MTTMTQRQLLDAIAKHADVNRAADYYGRKKLAARGLNLDAFAPLLKVKVTRSNKIAARRNAREEAPLAAACERRHGPGAAYEAGYISAPIRDLPASYLAKRCAEALAIGGLPDDLADLCREAVRRG